MTESRIVALVGSLRAGSINQGLAEAAAAAAPEGAAVEIFDGLAEVPFYNEDIDVADAVPASAAKLREAVAAADGVLVITPEYNGTMSAVLKNAVDWLSRPYGAGALSNKPVVVIGFAGGRFGGVWAQDDAKKSLGIAGARVLDELRLSVEDATGRYTAAHPREDGETVEQLSGLLGELLKDSAAAAV